MFQRIADAQKQHKTCLDLAHCGLTELPDALFELTWLEELTLSARSKTAEEPHFSALQDDTANDIRVLSPQIRQLKALKKLDIHNRK